MGIIETTAGVIEGAYPRVKYRKIIIERADVRLLNATPYTLVPAAGSGRVHLLHSVYIHKRSGTAYVLTGGGELVVRYGGGTGDDIMQFDGSDFAAATAIRRWSVPHSPNTGNADKTVSANDSVELHLSGANEYTAGGAGTPFEVHIYYQTVQE